MPLLFSNKKGQNKNMGLNNVWVISAYTLQEALKNRVLWIIIAFSVIGIAGASFLGDFAIIETANTEVAVLSSFYRMGAVFTMMVLVVTTMVREFNDKCLELYLSLPLSRSAYFFGKLTGFFVIGVIIAAVFAAVLLLFNTKGVGYLAFWFVSLTCELMIITAISFFCVMTFNQQAPASIVTAFFFYLLCRAADDIVLISNSEIILHTTSAGYLDEMVDVLVYVLPSLGAFTRPEWLLYGIENFGETALVVIGQTIVYTFLLSGATLIDFSRKNI